MYYKTIAYQIYLRTRPTQGQSFMSSPDIERFLKRFIYIQDLWTDLNPNEQV